MHTKNIKEKYKTNASIWFNKMSGHHQLTPSYVSTKVNATKRQYINILKGATHSRINQEGVCNVLT